MENSYLINLIKYKGTGYFNVNTWWNGDDHKISGNVVNGTLSFTISKPHFFKLENDIIFDSNASNQETIQNVAHTLIRMTNVDIAENIIIKQHPITQVVIFIQSHEAYEGHIYLFWDLKEWKELPVFYAVEDEEWICFNHPKYFPFTNENIEFLQ